MEKTKKPLVAVLGMGTIGKIVAENLIRSGRPVIIADRNAAKAQQIADSLGQQASSLEISGAIKKADIIVLAVWFDAIKEVFYQYREILAGKIIVDPSNPIAPDGNGGFVKKIGQAESAGELNAALLPKGAKLVKAFGTLASASLAGDAFQQPEKVLFYATDDQSIDAQVEELISDGGFAPLRVGGIGQSIKLEVFGELHQFGALGKTVTLAEAGSKPEVVA